MTMTKEEWVRMNTALTNEEIRELLTITLHGNLPVQTMSRIFATLHEVEGLRARVAKLDAPKEPNRDQERLLLGLSMALEGFNRTVDPMLRNDSLVALQRWLNAESGRLTEKNGVRCDKCLGEGCVTTPNGEPVLCIPCRGIGKV